MGSCVSVEKSSSASGSAVKLVAFDAKRDNLTTSASAFVMDDCSPPFDSGSKEELFFDSRAWLDSDCEDDFLSVDGEFTPSRGTTPVHHNFSKETETPQLVECAEPQLLSPTDNKKRLVELFKEANAEDGDDVAKTRTCLWLRTPVRSSAPATPSDSHRRVNGEERQQRRMRSAAHSCVPRLVSCSSFTERRRKFMSPAAVSPSR